MSMLEERIKRASKTRQVVEPLRSTSSSRATPHQSQDSRGVTETHRDQAQGFDLLVLQVLGLPGTMSQRLR